MLCVTIQVLFAFICSVLINVIRANLSVLILYKYAPFAVITNVMCAHSSSFFHLYVAL